MFNTENYHSLGHDQSAARNSSIANTKQVCTLCVQLFRAEEMKGGIKVEHFENSGQQSQKLKQQDALLILHRLQARFTSTFSSVNTAVCHYQSKAEAETKRLCSDSCIVA